MAYSLYFYELFFMNIKKEYSQWYVIIGILLNQGYFYDGWFFISEKWCV